MKIGTKDIKNGAVTSAKIKNKTIKPADLSKATVAKLRGKVGPRGSAGPRGATGPQGPGSQKFDIALEVGASREVDYRLGVLSLLCQANQVFTQVTGTAGAASNPLSAAGMTQTDSGPVVGLNSHGLFSRSFPGSGATDVWADLQVADANVGEVRHTAVPRESHGDDLPVADPVHPVTRAGIELVGGFASLWVTKVWVPVIE